VIFAIDPGTTQSGYVIIDRKTGFVHECGVMDNFKLKIMLRQALDFDRKMILVMEMIGSMGMAVGKEVFETCVWIGRFMEAWPGVTKLVYRNQIKVHLCGTTKAKDTNIRQALIDMYGGSKAIGTKKEPGPLYCVKSHAWSALAVAQYAMDNLTDH
jgi:hypothetical protein